MVRHVKNLDRWYQLPDGDAVTYRDELQSRTVELQIMAVGPCVVYLHDLDPLEVEPKAVGPKMLLGYVEAGEETFRFTREGHFAVSFDATEVWVYRDQVPVAADAGPVKSFTRFEKAGLYVDALGMALHRQSVLTKLAARQANADGIAYTRGLEDRLAALARQVEALTPPASEPPIAAPAAAAGA